MTEDDKDDKLDGLLFPFMKKKKNFIDLQLTSEELQALIKVLNFAADSAAFLIKIESQGKVPNQSSITKMGVNQNNALVLLEKVMMFTGINPENDIKH